MSTSRRKFITTGMFAALLAAGPAKSVLSQGWKDRDGNPIAQDDPLNNYSKAAFKSYLNSIFELQTTSGVVEVTLTRVDDLKSSRDGEAFTLLFRGGRRALKQDTYGLKHPALGTFALLLVPTGSDRNGAQGYSATINRLSYSEAVNNPAPSRSYSSKPARN